VEGEAAFPDPDLGRQREVVGAFMAASRQGNFERLVAVLHPDVVLRADMALGVSRPLRGAEAVARRSRMYHTLDRFSRPALVNGAAGIVVASSERTYAVMGFTVADGKIVAIDILADFARLEQLSLSPERSLVVGRTGEVAQLAQVKRHRREPDGARSGRAVSASNGTPPALASAREPASEGLPYGSRRGRVAGVPADAPSLPHNTHCGSAEAT